MLLAVYFQMYPVETSLYRCSTWTYGWIGFGFASLCQTCPCYPSTYEMPVFIPCMDLISSFNRQYIECLLSSALETSKHALSLVPRWCVAMLPTKVDSSSGSSAAHVPRSQCPWVLVRMFVFLRGVQASCLLLSGPSGSRVFASDNVFCCKKERTHINWDGILQPNIVLAVFTYVISFNPYSNPREREY